MEGGGSGGGVAWVGVGSMGSTIKVKFGINGSSADVETLPVPFRGRFAPVMERLASKQNVSMDECTFVFDGCAPRPNFTQEGLDLEGGEIVDVKLPEGGAGAAGGGVARSAQAAGTKNGCVASGTNGVVSEVGFGRSAPRLIQTNRNQLNNNPRQKTWKVMDTDPLSHLHAEYKKYYKPKGCKTVEFYFRDYLLGDASQTLRDLGIGDKAMVYAIENGKACIMDGSRNYWG